MDIPLFYNGREEEQVPVYNGYANAEAIAGFYSYPLLAFWPVYGTDILFDRYRSSIISHDRYLILFTEAFPYDALTGPSISGGPVVHGENRAYGSHQWAPPPSMHGMTPSSHQAEVPFSGITVTSTPTRVPRINTSVRALASPSATSSASVSSATLFSPATLASSSPWSSVPPSAHSYTGNYTAYPSTMNSPLPGNSHTFPESVSPTMTPLIPRPIVTSPATSQAAHTRRIHPARFDCQYCEQSFTAKHNLDLESIFHYIGHEDAHWGIKKYFCICGRSYTTPGDLNRHRKKKGCLISPPTNG
ncbi:hypothetical protein ONZ45_g4271 [Pleurotus djamor]|nr:hypothetical protein ONZ45_g4271 [Pleurotus djamor]